MNRCRYFFSYFSSSFSGIFYQFNYEVPIDWSKPYIVCPNHTSNLDITALILLVKRNYIFLGKDELLDNFITRIFFETIDIPINRNNRMSSYRAFKRTEACLQQGISLIIFPEGLISSHYPPLLQDFKNGPFRLAIENKIPILPVTIHNNWKIMWDDGSKYGSRPGICDICVHKPIDTNFLTMDDADDLKDQVFNTIANRLKKGDSVK